MYSISFLSNLSLHSLTKSDNCEYDCILLIQLLKYCNSTKLLLHKNKRAVNQFKVMIKCNCCLATLSLAVADPGFAKGGTMASASLNGGLGVQPPAGAKVFVNFNTKSGQKLRI